MIILNLKGGLLFPKPFVTKPDKTRAYIGDELEGWRWLKVEKKFMKL